MPSPFESTMSDTYLVTGASKGLGRSISISLANSGKSVIALARNSPELEELYGYFKRISPNSKVVSCDLASKKDIFSAVEIIKRDFSHLSGIVHNAGTILPIENMLDVSRESWARAVNVNLIGVQDITQSIVQSGWWRKPYKNCNDFKWCSKTTTTRLEFILCFQGRSRHVDEMLSRGRKLSEHISSGNCTRDC